MGAIQPHTLPSDALASWVQDIWEWWDRQVCAYRADKQFSADKRCLDSMNRKLVNTNSRSYV